MPYTCPECGCESGLLGCSNSKCNGIKRRSPMDKLKCSNCQGDGWYVGHANDCSGWNTGECNCGGQQIQCETCKGEGYV